MAYFDNAATTYPKPECVYQAMDRFYREIGGSAGRGGHHKAMQTGALIQETRVLLQELFHAENKQIIFTPTATLALNMILQGMIANGHIKTVYITPFEHNAVTRVLYSFKQNKNLQVRELTVDEHLHYDLEAIRYQFEEKAPDFVIVSHASNVCGLVAPIEEIFSLAKQYKAVTVADLSQTAGLIPLNLGSDLFDFAVFAGHKTLYGPTGISGFLKSSRVDLPPILFGGTGVESANQEMPQDIPARYEMGTLNTVGIAGLHAALQWIKATTIEAIQEKEQENREKLLAIFARNDFIKMVGIYPDNPYIGVVSCLLDEISSDSAAPLFDRLGIAVRTGLQCAPLAHKKLGTYPAGTIRFSVSYFTSEEDFADLEQTLVHIAAEY